MMELAYGKCSFKLHPVSAFLFLILCTGLLLLYEGSEVVTMQTRKTTSMKNHTAVKSLMKSTQKPLIMSSKPAKPIANTLKVSPQIHECLTTKAPPDGNYLRDALLLGRLPTKAEMCVMSVSHLDTLLQAYMNTVQILCGSSMVRMGARKDGGWDVCPNDRYLQKDNCLVYSFGINNDFSFDDEIARDYGCKVHSFDPSMRKKDHIRSQKPFVSFHATGLSNFIGTTADRNRWKMKTLSAIRQELGHTQVMPDVLKMDIEFSEWNALPEILHNTPVNDLPKQLIAEFHYFVFKTDLKTHWLKVLFTFKDLYDVGYRIAWISRNIDVNCIKKSKSTGKMYYLCHEVTFLKEIPPAARKSI
ncbi:uncharacterized protein LOC117324225 isoform X2 [Pecten maximus]|uniref:uncharacterized protein LOC117324225 isoform X2 n=1 Tax=Pecten maximus TaxID=6579 RepID=UPI0014591B98|nr:uncharacterized protein LOC117324225 isoform X2 [Pecten maximus]